MKTGKNEKSLKKAKPKNEKMRPARIMSKEEQIVEFASIIVDIYFELYHEKDKDQQGRTPP
jgi:hypothetical protein